MPWRRKYKKRLEEKWECLDWFCCISEIKQFQAKGFLVVFLGLPITNILFHFLPMDFMTVLWEGKSCWPLYSCLPFAICETLQYWDSARRQFSTRRKCLLNTIKNRWITTNSDWQGNYSNHMQGCCQYKTFPYMKTLSLSNLPHPHKKLEWHLGFGAQGLLV